MASFIEDEDIQFFDAQEDVVPLSNENCHCTDMTTANSSFRENRMMDHYQHQVWIQSPTSVAERRRNFWKWMMGQGSYGLALETSASVASPSLEGDLDSVRECNETLSPTSCFEDEFSSSRSSMSSCSDDNPNYSNGCRVMKHIRCRDAIFDGNIDLNGDKMGQCGEMAGGSEAHSDHSLTAEDSETNSIATPSFYQVLNRGNDDSRRLLEKIKKDRKHWWTRLRLIAKQGQAGKTNQERNYAFLRSRVEKVKVRLRKKQSKELSALYMGQDIQAHEGSILTMKFSPDGHYLASAGEDGIVRLWQVVKDERCNEIDIPEMDPLSIYFTVNHLSELTPLYVDKDKISKLKSLTKTPDSACVIFPPKVFRLLEKPLHEFCGHTGEILDLSWSRNNHLLSSSVDSTVRLWQVGYDECLKVFPHSNYVTCIQFNPLDDNYFISGSIDGKVRIWAISDCQVVDWVDSKEIITAVCYQPNGQGGIVGSLTGNCRFYNISGNHLQWGAQLRLFGKKKSTGKRITGFQFLPQDSNKVMVTCAWSQVKILQGLNVICKYKGNQLSASFTSDGKHIISVAEDANVYLWNFSNQEGRTASQSKKMKSFERFETDASVAIPWSGVKWRGSQFGSACNVSDWMSPQLLPHTAPANFSLSKEFFLEPFSNGNATWPEEELPTSSPQGKTSTMQKSQYKFLKSSCLSTSTSHAWGMVIVTAGWDGRIKSFVNYGLPIARNLAAL